MRILMTLSIAVSFGIASVAYTPELKAAETSQGISPVVGAVDHVGLAVIHLADTQKFFIEQLGFKLVGEDPSYPAAFVRNDDILITLWQVADPANAVSFDRRKNIGLHHMAFRVDSFQALDDLYARFQNTPAVKIEFSPELLGAGPAKHMMIYEPGGIRLEFIHRP